MCDEDVSRSEKYIQDTPNYIINAQSVIIIQVQGNEKPELDIKTAKFPGKEEIIFQACLTSYSSGLWNKPSEEQGFSHFDTLHG